MLKACSKNGDVEKQFWYISLKFSRDVREENNKNPVLHFLLALSLSQLIYYFLVFLCSQNPNDVTSELIQKTKKLLRTLPTYNLHHIIPFQFRSQMVPYKQYVLSGDEPETL